MTQCTQQIPVLQDSNHRPLNINFNGGDLSSDGGLILVDQLDQKLGLLAHIGDILEMLDMRQKSKVKHSAYALLRQRIYALICGYEDLNDHDQLRKDPLFQEMVKRQHALASSSTLCRYEQTIDRNICNAISILLVEQFISNYKTAPKELILDFDATDITVHGMQEDRWFNGYYKDYCYLPLYVFCDDHLLAAYLRSSDKDAAKHSGAILRLLVKRFRQQWPNVPIIFRGDSGFYRQRILDWCDTFDVKYIVGFAKNTRLDDLSSDITKLANEEYSRTNEDVKYFSSFQYRAWKWKKERCIIAKAEHNTKGPNNRYVVTNLQGEAEDLYSRLYCMRGDMENRIKEQKVYLFASRTSSSRFMTNQFRLLLSAIAYTLMRRLRALFPKGTKYAHEQCHTIRDKFIKVCAIIRKTTRNTYISFSSNYAYKDQFIKYIIAIGNLQ